MKLGSLAVRLIVIASYCTASIPTLAESRCCMPMRVDVSTSKAANGEPALSVALTNIGKDVIEFPAGYGPWAGPGNGRFGLIALRLPANVPIVNNRRPLINPEPGNLKLVSGESIKQELLLRDFFPEAAKEINLGQEDIVIFWTYQLVIRGQPSSEHFGGWVLYPKQ